MVNNRSRRPAHQHLHFKSKVFLSVVLPLNFRTMDGANEVGELKVSRLQMEGENHDKTPAEHKVGGGGGGEEEKEFLSASPLSVWAAWWFDTLLCGFSSSGFMFTCVLLTFISQPLQKRPQRATLITAGTEERVKGKNEQRKKREE